MYFSKECKALRHICDKWTISKADLWKNGKSKKLSVFIENEIRKCEGVVEMIKELSKGINLTFINRFNIIIKQYTAFKLLFFKHF